jgi:hypothetical protein
MICLDRCVINSGFTGFTLKTTAGKLSMSILLQKICASRRDNSTPSVMATS